MIRVLAKGKAGLVILQDDRDDGSHVLLQCEELQSAGDGGVLVSPSDDAVYPMQRLMVESTKKVAASLDNDAFTLEVDISEMPTGLIPLRTGQFIERVVSLATAGDDHARITPANASEWGLLEGAAAAS